MRFWIYFQLIIVQRNWVVIFKPLRARNRPIGIMFVNGSSDWGSIQDRVIPKTPKMVLDDSLLDTQYYKVWIKGKVSNPGKGVALLPTLRCSSYWKGSLRVTLDYGRQLYYYESILILILVHQRYPVIKSRTYWSGWLIFCVLVIAIVWSETASSTFRIIFRFIVK